MRERGLRWGETPSAIYIRDDDTYYGPPDHVSPRNCCAANTMPPAEARADEAYTKFKAELNRIFTPYRLQPPPSLEELRATLAGTSRAEVLETALSTPLWELHERFFTTTRQLDQYACEGASFNRNPLAISLAFNSIDEPDDEDANQKPPVEFVSGGMGEVSRLLLDNALEAGATVTCGIGVEKILVDQGQATGVLLQGGEQRSAHLVVSNLDPLQTFLRLVPANALTTGFIERVKALKSPVACLKLLAVVNELPDWPQWDGPPERMHLGAVRLGGSRERIAAAYDDLEAGRPPRFPVMSVNFPSCHDPSLTTPGCHTASIWIFPAAAELKDYTWDNAREVVTENLVDRITEFAPNFQRSIIHRKLRTPQDLERENSLTGGCIWHVQNDAETLFWNRPLPELSRYRAPIDGLFLCGAGQHPGGEVSGLTGHNAAHEILKDGSP